MTLVRRLALGGIPPALPEPYDASRLQYVDDSAHHYQLSVENGNVTAVTLGGPTENILYLLDGNNLWQVNLAAPFSFGSRTTWYDALVDIHKLTSIRQ